MLFTLSFVFFFNDTATTEIYTLSLHDALPISRARPARRPSSGHPGPAAAPGRAPPARPVAAGAASIPRWLLHRPTGPGARPHGPPRGRCRDDRRHAGGLRPGPPPRRRPPRRRLRPGAHPEERVRSEG